MEARNQAVVDAIANANAYLNNVAIPNYSDLINQVAQQNAALAQMVVQIEVKVVYGMETIYPANDKARIFAALAGKKTLNSGDLIRVRELGFSVERVMGKVEVPL